LWNTLKKLGLSLKKRAMLPNGRGLRFNLIASIYNFELVR